MALGNKSNGALTPREEEVMERLAKGRLYKEIADELGISSSAVKKHVGHIFLKVQVENRTEAAVKWIELKTAKNHGPEISSYENH
jgi:DNA-binding NarL/FixJ family response regulator